MAQEPHVQPPGHFSPGPCPENGGFEPPFQGPVVGAGSREGKEEPVSLSAVYPHRIRLRGPWECEPQGGPPARRVIMPCRWLEAGLADFHGAARFTRSFGYPGNVDDSEHVWLTCDGCTGCRGVRLNGQLL